MYIELHACSAFSFLEGSALPEQLVSRAAQLGYPSLALLDRDGVYGAPRFYKEAQKVGVRPLVGSEITLMLSRPDTGGLCRLPVLVENQTGYRNLCRLVTRVKLRAPKGEGQTSIAELQEFYQGLVCLTGGDNGPLRALLREHGVSEAQKFLEQLVSIFGSRNVYVELQRHFIRRQEEENQTLISLAGRLRLPLLATNGVLYDQACSRALLDVLTCIRHKTNLDEAGTLLQQNAERYLKAPGKMEKIFADCPAAIAHTVELAARLNFTLQDLGYKFPAYPVPAGESMSAYLRCLTHMGGLKHYGVKDTRAWKQIGRELDLIEKLDLAGYFLIVWDIVRFCREANIMVQGRGSAANSAVCYSLGITAVDPIRMDLLFERFLSEERGEWPDIDLDFPSGDRRERAIQYVYERYGKHGAAMTANVITYRDKSASREVGKALGFGLEQIDRLSKLISTWGYHGEAPNLAERLSQAGFHLDDRRVAHFARLWESIQDLPRHLGQHSGGMVICQGALDSVVPLENAAMPGRVVVQWDKEDCADMGIVKVDLLGLGMMSVLQDSIGLISDAYGDKIDLAHLPADDPRVYRMLQRADTIGLFQVESRAQMATLPRLKPECFYDLVVEIAIIRPGPIVGNMVHPYLNRRAGREPVQYPHPCLEPILKRTLGVPLFQEQLLRIAMVAANFSGGEAEELRRAFGFKRSEARMKTIEVKLRRGMEENGITGDTAEQIIHSITAFALYGFPESHSASFALLAYASAYLKVYYPAAFYTGLLNNQPMGFYHPATLIKDAQRRGVRVRPVDVLCSDYDCAIEEDKSMRLGLRMVAGMKAETGRRIAQERKAKPFTSLDDLKKRTPVNRSELATLAEIGALNSLGLRRRGALWQIEKTARPAGELFENLQESDSNPLPDMTLEERIRSDYRGTGVTVGPHPISLYRRALEQKGVVPARLLHTLKNGKWVRIAGSVIVRQRPGTAKGFFFVTLEDETGVSNAIFRPQMFEEQRSLLVSSPCLLIEGVLQNVDGVISVKAERAEPLDVTKLSVPSHDFH
ncbi:MAG TPA: error-prone DNA polymerase [Acidobacteriota bacterium]|jgi:error-prone DNA polymerase